MLNLLALTTGAIVGIAVGAVVLVLLIILIWWISCRNAFVRLRNTTDEAWATIDVHLKKRYDLIPNLVNTVKGYAAHEKDTLEAVINARNLAMTSTGDAKMAAENALSGTLKSLFALQEAYPQLKANSNFTQLQSQLQSIETELASARKYYNATVKMFNTKIDMFPSNLVARGMHLEKRKFFELESSDERRAPTVQF